jgi:hypothetical protein
MARVAMVLDGALRPSRLRLENAAAAVKRAEPSFGQARLTIGSCGGLSDKGS